jgi:hypothetical protein
VCTYSTADVQSRSGDLGDDPVTGDLEWEITGEEDRDGGSELLSGHVQVGHDALQLGHGQVLTVDVVEDIQDDTERQCPVLATTRPGSLHDRKDGVVDLSHHLLLHRFPL